MRTFVAPLAYGLTLLALTASLVTSAVAAPSLRIFGHGKPSARQREKFVYMFNGRKVARVARRAVVNKTKSR